MDKKMKIEYIRYYSAGSEALMLEPQRTGNNQTHRARRPVAKKARVVVLSLDPLALTAIAVALVMVVLMGVGIASLKNAQQERDRMAAYVQTLEKENQELTEYFESGYSLEAIEKAALSLGMVPIEDVAHIRVEMDPTPVEVAPEPTVLERVYHFFIDLFA